MKKLTLLLLASGLAIAIASCAQDSDDDKTTTPAATTPAATLSAPPNPSTVFTFPT